MALHDIPLAVEAAEPGLTGQADAILREVATLLERLCSGGEKGSIDLRSLPLSPTDRDWLRDRLGKGEVSISLDAGGRSCLTETAIAGVWWVEHRDTQDEMRGEFIEVAAVPALVAASRDDMASGLQQLKTLIDR